MNRPLGIRLIVIQKSVWAIVLIVLSVILFWFRARHITQPIQSLFDIELDQDPHDLLANLLVRLVPNLTLRAELLLGAGAAIYAVLEIVEAWGLWRLLLWVELLTVFETSAVLPYEVWDIFRQPSVLKALTIVINVVVVWYLVTRYLRKRAEHLAGEAEALARRLEQKVIEGREPTAE